MSSVFQRLNAGHRVRRRTHRCPTILYDSGGKRCLDSGGEHDRKQQHEVQGETVGLRLGRTVVEVEQDMSYRQGGRRPLRPPAPTYCGAHRRHSGEMDPQKN